jgi:hypothetical protein
MKSLPLMVGECSVVAGMDFIIRILSRMPFFSAASASASVLAAAVAAGAGAAAAAAAEAEAEADLGVVLVSSIRIWCSSFLIENVGGWLSEWVALLRASPSVMMKIALSYLVFWAHGSVLCQ